MTADNPSKPAPKIFSNWRRLFDHKREPQMNRAEREKKKSLLERITLGAFALAAYIVEAYAGLVVAAIVAAFMATLAAFYFSEPGLVEWIADLFVQNCRVNGVCTQAGNMAAFAVANVVAAEICAYVLLFLMGFWAKDDAASEAQMRELDAAQMSTLDEVQALRADLESLRHELLPLDPQGAPINGRDN